MKLFLNMSLPFSFPGCLQRLQEPVNQTACKRACSVHMGAWGVHSIKQPGSAQRPPLPFYFFGVDIGNAANLQAGRETSLNTAPQGTKEYHMISIQKL